MKTQRALYSGEMRNCKCNKALKMTLIADVNLAACGIAPTLLGTWCRYMWQRV